MEPGDGGQLKYATLCTEQIYTGSLFHITNIVCHFRPIFRRAFEWPVEWDTLMRYASRQVANTWEIKQLTYINVRKRLNIEFT